MARLRVGVLISGRGSNLQALIDAAAAPDFPAALVLVISNRPDAAGLDRARAAGIPTRVISHREPGFERAVDDALRGAGVGLVCLAGFMRILSAEFVERWADRLINIHPSLLPAFPGLDTHGRALAAGAAVAGCTVHFVRAEVDAGPIILQEQVPVLAGDTAASLAARVLAAEHRIYPAAVRMVAAALAKPGGSAISLGRD
jgi:phosphoribosylglycinamide formyltransferase-1